jgi:hypothetical protein
LAPVSDIFILLIAALILIDFTIIGIEKVLFVGGEHHDLETKPIFYFDTASVSGWDSVRYLNWKLFPSDC